jgi:hypothetical protein
VNDSRIRALLAVLVAAIGIGVTVSVVDNGPDHQPGEPRRTVTVTLGGPGHEKIALPPPAQKIVAQQKADAAAGDKTAVEAGLHAEPVAATAPTTVRADRAVAPVGQPVAPLNIPLASVNPPGCKTLQVRNQSSRAGAPSLLIVLHQTISPDNGWAGVNANVAWFNSPAAQASSNYIVSRAGGQCAYIVPEAKKAWAQAGFNSVTACSIEVTETGKEGSYLVGAGKTKVIAIVRDCARRWHIPLQHGRVSGCKVTRPGVVEHRDLGQCGGGHFDDSPYSIDSVIAAAHGHTAKPVTATDRATCRKLTWWRNHGRPRGKPERNAIRRRHALEHRGVSCTKGTAVRRR